jgi:hypothetical protein
MATFDMSKSTHGISLQKYLGLLAGQVPGNGAAQTSTGFDWVTAPLSQPSFTSLIHFTGSGFVYPASPFPGYNLAPTDGMVTSISYTDTLNTALGPISTNISVTGLSRSIIQLYWRNIGWDSISTIPAINIFERR